MTHELCPYCGLDRETALEWFHNEQTAADGHVERTLTVVFYCRECGTLIRSNDLVEEEGLVNPAEEGVSNR